MTTIAFIGRKQNVRAWRFVVDGLERARVEERRALEAAVDLGVVDDLRGADLVQVRLNPEQTSARALRRVLSRVRRLPAATRVLNSPEAFALSAEKNRTYTAWRAAGLRTLEWTSWSLWTPLRGQVARVRAFLDGRAGYLRTHNEDSGKGIIYLAGAEDDRALERALWRLRLRALTNRVSGSRALLTAEIDNRVGDVGQVFRVHMVGSEIIGGYAVVGRGRIIHALDVDLADVDAFVAANERLTGWLMEVRWRALWHRAMAAVRLDFGSLEFLCVDGEPVFLDVNPMWGGRHRFGPELTRWLTDEAPDVVRERIAHVFAWLTPFTFYERYWRAIAAMIPAEPGMVPAEPVTVAER